jgi:hypothetical protein
MRTSHRVVRAIAVSVPLAMLLGAAPGLADPTIYYRVGNWHAFTDKDAQGIAVCGIGTESQADGRALTLTYTIGGTDLMLHAAKPGWAIPDGTALDVSEQIDSNPSWTAGAVGHGTTVEWAIGAAAIVSFDAQFRAGSTMTVSFPSGNETPWTLSLSGSSAASGTLWRCVQELSAKARASASTQPFGQAPTQPFTPAPPQPQAPPGPTPTTKP